MATFSAAAFADDELYGFTNPYLAEYPMSFRDYFLRKIRLRNVLPDHTFWVAVLDERDEMTQAAGDQSHGSGSSSQDVVAPDGEVVVGYADWSRYGDSDAAKQWQVQSWTDWFESLLLQAQDKYIDFFQLDWSISPSRARELDMLDFWGDEFMEFPDRWHLRNLCVDPKYQRRGVGAMLLSWGLEQANQDKVPITLSTSTMAESLYRRHGFKTWRRKDMPGVRMDAPSLIRWPFGKETEATEDE
ncbi:MAG: hypothetical protein Q9220_007299 [cf. Caloplaca sp. 1 TL-2023]